MTRYRNHSARARLLARALDLAARPLVPLLRRAAPRGPAAAPPRSILVVRLDHLGDMLMTTPAIAALHAAFPEARLDVLASPAGRAALAGNPDVDEILEAPAPWYDPRRGELPPAPDVLAAAARLRRRGYDLGLDMRGDFRAVLFYLLPAARRRLGFAGLGLERLLTEALPYDPRRPWLDRALDLARAAGAADRGRATVFRVSNADRAAARDALRRAGLPPGDPYAVVAPGSNRPNAQWGPGRYGDLCDLLEGGGVRAVLSGAPADRAAARQVAAAARRAPIDLTGQSLGAMAAMMEEARVVVANDSGAAHLAAAVGAALVAVFGPGDPALTFPYEGAGRVALAAPIDHSRPCLDIRCASTHGFEAIAPRAVYDACAPALSRQLSQTNG